MKSFLFLGLLLWASLGQAQDERFFRRILSGDLIESERGSPVQKTYHFVAKTPLYELDLNDDGKNEAFSYEMKDGENWVEIFSAPDGKKSLFKGKFETAGKDANLFKISMRDLSSKVKVLLLFFYEGNSQYLELNSTARIYLLTLEKGDWTTLTLSQGPTFWQEREERNLGYYQRNYAVDLADLNSDGIKELVVKHGRMSQVLMYLGKGRWKKI